MFYLIFLKDSKRKCGVYRFLDQELPSDYYKQLLFEIHENLEAFKMKENLAAIEELGETRMEVLQVWEELKIKKANIKIYEKICFVLLVVVMLLCVCIGVFVL